MADNQAMGFASCCTGMLATLSRAAARAAGAKLRALGALGVHPDWARRAASCERCPLRVIRGGTTYCGRPFLDRPARTPHEEGCGCPTVAKAKDPGEHCPLDVRNRPAETTAGGGCTCKWCT